MSEFEKWWEHWLDHSTLGVATHEERAAAAAAWEASERALVRRLAGEWGEQEIFPTESVEDCVKHIHATGRVFLYQINTIQLLKQQLSNLRGDR